jgi:F420-dependent oxidoreductase-like protein
MELCIFVEPQQGATYHQQLAMACATERLGFTGFFRSDHYLKMGAVTGQPGPTDTWMTLAAIGLATERIRLGSLVCSATFRLPGPLAVAVAQADQMSGGRVELGLGAGWYGDEHTAYGIPFPTLGARFDALAEQLEIITGLWRTPVEAQFSFEGDTYSVVASPALPKPVQPGGPPIIMGGYGPRRSPALAARFASEFNVPFPDRAAYDTQRARVAAACEAIGRDPEDLPVSVALVVCCGEDDEQVEHRAGAIGRSAAELRQNGLAGTPSEVLDGIASWMEAGAQRLYLQVLDLADIEHVELLGEQVLRLLPGFNAE